MTAKLIFVKNFSHIAGIQDSFSMKYYLTKSNDGDEHVYGIQLISDQSSTLIPEISKEEQVAMDLLTFLFENSVNVDTVHDVVHDVMGRAV